MAFVFYSTEQKTLFRWMDNKNMKDLISILQSENASVKLEVSGEDLLEFSNELINRAKSELSAEYAEARKEKYLTKEEVKRMCEVCDATLWHWNRKGYLKAIKVVNKVRYRQSDVQRILEGGSVSKEGGLDERR
jgi:hypothetical protein